MNMIVEDKIQEISKTKFDAKTIQPVLERLWELRYPQEKAPVIKSYQEFLSLIPEMQGSDYSVLAEKALAEHKDIPLIIGGSSGTSGASKLVLERTNTPGRRPSETDIQLITELRIAGILNPGDVAVNLFMVGMYSILHQGFNRLLEACYSSVIPLGSLSPEHIEQQLSFMKKCNVNVLAGTPGTLIQIAHAVRSSGIELNVKRILYTGERMGAAKMTVLKEVFSGVRIVGFYGLSECGFVAVEQNDGSYCVRENAYFLEKNEQGHLLVTSLNPELPTPIVRYDTGDQVELVKTGERMYLQGIDRADTSFNFIGNLIDVKSIRQWICTTLDIKDVIVEVEINTDMNGCDDVLIKIFSDDMTEKDCVKAHSFICTQEEFKEGIDKKAGSLSLALHEPHIAHLSSCNKHRQIIDNRG